MSFVSFRDKIPCVLHYRSLVYVWDDYGWFCPQAEIGFCLVLSCMRPSIWEARDPSVSGRYSQVVWPSCSIHTWACRTDTHAAWWLALPVSIPFFHDFLYVQLSGKPEHQTSDSPTLILVIGSSLGGFGLVWSPNQFLVLLCCCYVHVPF